MKQSVLLSVLLLILKSSIAQYKPVDNGSTVQFKIKHFGIPTGGSFSGLQGNISFETNRLNTASFDVSIDAGTVNTGVEMRDNHLRGEDYFDAKDYPRIHFVSTKVTGSTQPGVFFAFGKLTIKNQTREISFPFTANNTHEGYLFKGSFTINRRDFGVGGSGVISDNLDVDLSILAVK